MRTRKRNRNRLFTTWRNVAPGTCLNCRRAIEQGDKIQHATLYDEAGPFDTTVHLDCREVQHRTRLAIPRKLEFITNEGDQRRKFNMTPAEQNGNGEATEETTKVRKTRKAGKSSKTSSKTKAKTAKKTKAPKAKREGAGSMAATAAQRLAPLMKGNKTAAPILRALEGGSASHKQLETLKELVKEKAAEAREAGKGKQASELSAANSIVRRLERAAR